MIHTSRIFAAAMAALTIISCSSAVSAAPIMPFSETKIICKDGNCGKIYDILKKYCSKNCNINIKDIMNSGGGYCPNGNCSTNKRSQLSSKTAKSDPAVKETANTAKSDNTAFNTAYETEVLRLVNAERAKYGLSPLAKDKGATDTAHLRAKEIVKSFSHTRPNGSSCFTATKEFGVSYRTAGENIAYGYTTPEKVVEGWMNSEGHRKNILSTSFSKIGIGCYKSNGIMYWSQFFIG